MELRWHRRERSFLRSLAASPSLSVSTVPVNGDQNPYGVTLVPHGFPLGDRLRPGDAIVSNFNNNAGLQGTGRTIVRIAPDGTVRTFFEAPASLGPVGLTTALAALRSGIVVVGNTPTVDGTFGTIQNGSLIFIDGLGNVLLSLSDSELLRGPWDLAVDERDASRPILYVSCVLNGTVTRVNLRVATLLGLPTTDIQSLTRVASGFQHRPDPAALVVGPTGLVLSRSRENLFVADTGNNRIQFVHGVRGTRVDRGSGKTVVSGPPLRGPLALAKSPFDTLVTSNGDAAGNPSTPPNLIVEIDPKRGRFVATRQLDTSGIPGGLFGIDIARFGDRASLLFVDDNTNTFNVLPSRHPEQV